MSLILHTGFDKDIKSVKENFTDDSFIELRSDEIKQSELLKADLVLIGPRAQNALQIAQAVSKKDTYISTIILPAEQDYPQVKQALLFTPFISKSTLCLPFTEETLPQLHKASLQTQQRRKFARVDMGVRQQSITKTRNVEIEQLDTFLNEAPIGAILVNSEYNIVAVNAFARRMFNLLPLETVSALHVIWEKNAAELIIRHLQTKKNTRTLEISSNGQYYEVTFSDVISEKGEKLDILLITNITDRKLEDQRIRSVLDALPQMAWTTNPNGEVTYLTEGWYKFTGQTYGQAMKDGWKQVIHPEDITYFVDEWEKALASGQPFEQMARYRRFDGKYRWHLVRGTPIYSGTHKLSYWIGTCTDIDEQKVHEEELSSKVKSATEKLRRMNEFLKKSNEDLKSFARKASRDLKTPLHDILHYLNLIKEEGDPSLQKKHFQKVEDAANNMSDLIEYLSKFSHPSENTNHDDAESVK